ncbi:MAG: ABC transporter ATP-binding protein [Sphaerochaeta sp.]|nr:ABC transporter ATP-binding protein [Sphaerochaeta sp.]
MRINPFGILSKLRAILTRRQKQKSIILLLLFVVMALTQVIGVAAIFPFMNLVMDPGQLASNRALSFIYNLFGFSSSNSFILFIGIALFLFIILSNVVSALTVYARTRFVMGLNHELSSHLLAVYLAKPYPFFLNRNTSTLGKNLLSEVYQLTNGLLMPIFELVVNVLIALTLVAVLFVSDPISAAVVLVIVGGCYVVINLKTRKKIRRSGRERLDANQGRYKITGEALSGIKTTKVLGREHFFIDQFNKDSRRFTEVETTIRVIREIPRYALDALAFGTIALLVVILTIKGGSAANVIPMVSLFAFAGYRMLPAMQAVFASVTSIYFNQPILDTLYEDLVRGPTLPSTGPIEAMRLNSEIVLDAIRFSYPDTSIPVLNHINVTIRKNTTVSFVGATGSGKTTLIDIILGLLTAQEGTLLVDGVPITAGNVRNWQQTIGYVPQDIFLSDDTVERNIAFGVAQQDIDRDRVIQAARIAALDSFITHDMKDGYDTIIGERGIRLSGGQRQRIGLARALYDNPPVLVLDEATSSLDGITETEVMDAIKSASKDRTVIMIAHRLSTVQNCDVIYLMEKGDIIAAGTYDELLATNATFRKMAKQ